MISSQLDIKLGSLSQLAVLTDCDTKAVPGGQDLFLDKAVVSIQSTQAGTNVLTQTGAVSWMLSMLRTSNITSKIVEL